MVKNKEDTSDTGFSRRRLSVALALLIPLLGLAAILVYEQQTPPAWRRLLDAYLVDVAGESWTVRAVHSAQTPEGLTEDLPLVPITDNPYYRLPDTNTEAVDASNSHRPMPYPPSQAECIFLEREKGETRVLVIAHHADVYNATWILHVADATGAALDNALTRIGCPTLS